MPIRPSGSWGAVGGEFGLGARPGPNPPMAWLGYLCRSSQAAIASYFGGHRAIAGQRAVAAAARLPKRRALRAQHEIGTPELFYSAAAAHTAHARGAHATALAQGQPVVREARDGQCGHRPCPYRAQIPHSAAAAPPVLLAPRGRHLRRHLLDTERHRSSLHTPSPSASEQIFNCCPLPQAGVAVVSVGRRTLRSCLPKPACCSSRSSRGLGAWTSALSAPQARATAVLSKPDQLPFTLVTPQHQQRLPADAAGSDAIDARPFRTRSSPMSPSSTASPRAPHVARLGIGPWRHGCARLQPHGLVALSVK